jgi:uncharacterized protein (TIGR03437 family)
VLNQTRYRLRVGEVVKLAAPPETIEFVRNARTAGVVGGEKGFVFVPSDAGNEVLLAASLLATPGEHTVRLSAVNKAGEERVTTANVVLDPLQPVPSNATSPPVVLLNGWQFSCPITSTSPHSRDTFGDLETNLRAGGAQVVYFFDNCVEGPNGRIEDLGQTLGQVIGLIRYDNGLPVPQVDLVGHSMGGLIVRSYLAGLRSDQTLAPPGDPKVRKFIEIATPNFGSFLAPLAVSLLGGVQPAEMTPGSTFLWNLATWNQRGDDLRGVDALAVIGNGGYAPASGSPPARGSDGLVSLTSASLGFARDLARTRILPYCHSDFTQAYQAFVDCLGSSIASAPETAAIVISFLANTSAWQTIGSSQTPPDPWLSQYGGIYFTSQTAAGQPINLNKVTFGTAALTNGGAAGTVFYNEFIKGTDTFLENDGAFNCGPFTQPVGYYYALRCKFSPQISSIGPLLTTTPEWVVQSGATITINGIGFGQQQCSTCQVSISPNLPLRVLTWSDQAITAVLPSFSAGALGLTVQTGTGSDYITFMATPAPPPPVISLSATQLQFAYTVGGAMPPPQTITVVNSGGGTFTWSATASASWLTLSSATGLLTVSVNPTALTPNTYQGSITITAPAATNSPQTISVTLTVSAAAVQLTTKNSASFGIVSLAPDVIAFSEAPGIASALAVAPGNPWPPTLGGVSLEITDSQSQKRLAPLYYVTTNAMSYLIPAGTALGLATAKLTTSTGASITGSFNVDRVSPGLFTANATGSGVPAGFWIRVAADATQSQDYLFDPTKPVGSRVPVPVDLGASSDQVFLSLYGTGFRGATQATAKVGGVTVPVSGFAAVGVYQGEDVVNIGPLPRSLAGRGEIDVATTFDGKPANTVTVSIR